VVIVSRMSMRMVHQLNNADEEARPLLLLRGTRLHCHRKVPGSLCPAGPLSNSKGLYGDDVEEET
jgi:hypothetical protein